MSKFNSTQYKVIAKAIDNSRDPKDPDFILISHLINLLSFYFSQDNPRFNDSAFRIACGEMTGIGSTGIDNSSRSML